MVELDCAEAEYAHIQECQETHSPIIAQAQAAALEMLPEIQEAMYNLQTEQAIQFALARKLNELEGIAAREYQITCFKAQYDQDLAVGTEVEMAKTPNGRHAITAIVTAAPPCLHDARVLPSGHLFVNSALYPGYETWRPNWRVGTVIAQDGNDLSVQLAPALVAGSLGTLYSENPIDCTPPQIYFDGVDPKDAEADIVAARTALAYAQQTLLDAVKIKNDCIAVYDQAWLDQCYGTAVEICDETYSASIEPALQDRATCYADGPANCETSVADGLEACEAAFRPAIDEKQAAVDVAQGVVTTTAQDLVDAQQALAAIEAEIQVCVDAINDPGWPAEHPGEDPEEALAACRSDRQGDLDAAEADIDAAYYPAMQAELILGQAEDALEAAENDLADCNQNWNLAACIASAMAVCDDTYTQATEYFTLAKAACYEQAMQSCDEQRDEAIQACRDANADAIEAAQFAVDGAVRDVELATNGRYNPAESPILTCPVAHCLARTYQPGDEVLIDFPVRSGSAMAVWDSRRVIGWATETRRCGGDGIYLNYGQDGFTIACDSTINNFAFPVYDDYWAGGERIIHWVGTTTYCSMGDTRYNILAAMVQSVQVVRDNTEIAIDLLVYATHANPYIPALAAYGAEGDILVMARDQSIPDQQERVIAVISQPESGWGSDSNQFFGFSATSGALAVSSTYNFGNVITPWKSFGGFVASAVVPFDHWATATAELAFNVVMTGDEPFTKPPSGDPWMGERNVVLGARWDGDSLLPYVIKYQQTQIHEVTHTRGDLLPDGWDLEYPYSFDTLLTEDEIDISWQCTGGLDIQIYKSVSSIEVTTTSEVVQWCYEAEGPNGEPGWTYCFPEASYVTTRTRIYDEEITRAGVDPIRRFSFPIIYHSKKAYRLGQSVIVKDCTFINGLPPNLEPEDYYPDECLHPVTTSDHTWSLPTPSIKFVNGPDTLGEVDLVFTADGVPTEDDVSDFYTLSPVTTGGDQAINSIYDLFHINQKHVIFPCWVLQAVQSLPFADFHIHAADFDVSVIYVNGELLDIGENEGLLYTCQTMIPLSIEA